MAQKAAGKAFRKGISLLELFEMFPTEESARRWLEEQRWPEGKPVCPKCQSRDTAAIPKEKPTPYRCRTCKLFFSVRTGTAFERSHVPLRKWVIAIYLSMTSLKGVSSMKLHRDLKVTQKTAWFMAHRIRIAWKRDGGLLAGPVEVDETYVGGKEENKHANKKLKAGRGTVGKTAVVGVKDRETGKVVAMPVANTDKDTLQGFVHDNVDEAATVYTDDHLAGQLRRPILLATLIPAWMPSITTPMPRVPWNLLSDSCLHPCTNGPTSTCQGRLPAFGQMTRYMACPM